MGATMAVAGAKRTEGFGDGFGIEQTGFFDACRRQVSASTVASVPLSQSPQGRMKPFLARWVKKSDGR